jgi:hypothetical protein
MADRHRLFAASKQPFPSEFSNRRFSATFTPPLTLGTVETAMAEKRGH